MAAPQSKTGWIMPSALARAVRVVGEFLQNVMARTVKACTRSPAGPCRWEWRLERFRGVRSCLGARHDPGSAEAAALRVIWALEVAGNKKPAPRPVFCASQMTCCLQQSVSGAPKETRTLTLLPAADFESAASTNSAIEAMGAQYSEAAAPGQSTPCGDLPAGAGRCTDQALLAAFWAAWLAACRAVRAMVKTMSSTSAPRDRSFTGLARPCSIGPTLRQLALRCTAL